MGFVCERFFESPPDGIRREVEGSPDFDGELLGVEESLGVNLTKYRRQEQDGGDDQSDGGM